MRKLVASKALGFVGLFALAGNPPSDHPDADEVIEKIEPQNNGITFNSHFKTRIVPKLETIYSFCHNCRFGIVFKNK